jgi:hypothetical protein
MGVGRKMNFIKRALLNVYSGVIRAKVEVTETFPFLHYLAGE